jgi:hypothetical protein
LQLGAEAETLEKKSALVVVMAVMMMMMMMMMTTAVILVMKMRVVKVVCLGGVFSLQRLKKITF